MDDFFRKNLMSLCHFDMWTPTEYIVVPLQSNPHSVMQTVLVLHTLARRNPSRDYDQESFIAICAAEYCQEPR
jgi:hypothetical protein